MGSMNSEKRILIIAGPNGAGKTTFATEFLPNEAGCPTFINADMIAAGLNPFEPERYAVRAGRLMLSMIGDYVSRGESFAFETTLSGRGYARLIPTWQAQGYQVLLYFLRLPTPEMAVARVKNRVGEGGHNIPEDVVRRRFAAGRRNFKQMYRDKVDGWELCDTTGCVPLRIDGKREPMTAEIPATLEQTPEPDHAELALVAMRRAAIKARRRAIETKGYVVTWRDGKMVRDTEV